MVTKQAEWLPVWRAMVSCGCTITTIKATTVTTNPYASRKKAYYALVLLTIVYSFNFIDRQLLAILQESVKADLDLSDSQLGLLTGFAFAAFYVIAGIPCR